MAKRFEVDAVVEKRLVVVAFPMVAVVAVRVPAVAFVAKRFVEVAFVVVLFVAVIRANVESTVVEVALIAATVGVDDETRFPFASVVTTMFAPIPERRKLEATRFVVKRFVEVALVVVPLVTVSDAMVDDAFERNPANVGLFENTNDPVPVSSVISAASSAEVSSEVDEILLLKILQSVEESLPFDASPANGRLNVRVDPLPVIEKSVPRVDVASVTAGPVVVCPIGPIEVSAAVRP
jgi:hypothetical protein